MTLIEQAFKCNTSGNGRCYYGATIYGVRYEGERDWDKRWELLENCTDYKGKNVLEIGCNMGIYITYLKKFSGIKTAIGIDQPDELLLQTNKKDTIKAARLLADGMGVDVRFEQFDLNKDPYEAWFPPETFDIAIVLSIFKWIDDKQRFLSYLSGFKTIIYEGHDSDNEEIERFEKLGFKHRIIGQTQVGKSYAENQYRTLIIFDK